MNTVTSGASRDSHRRPAHSSRFWLSSAAGWAIARTYNSPTRQAQAGATRVAILDAARQVFAESGYAAATIEAVAAAAQVSVPTVYAVFGSKPRLLAALVADAGSARDI